jgi:hypothetical protein
VARLIYKGNKWGCDLEWGFLTDDAPAAEVEEHAELASQTERLPEDIEIEDYEPPRARRVRGFVPNRTEE